MSLQETFGQPARPFKRPGVPQAKTNLQESPDEAHVPSKECRVVAECGCNAMADGAACESAGAAHRGGSCGANQASSVRRHFERQSGFCLRGRPVDCCARRRSGAAADFARWGRAISQVFAGWKIDCVHRRIRRQPGRLRDFGGRRRAEAAHVSSFERHRPRMDA